MEFIGLTMSLRVSEFTGLNFSMSGVQSIVGF